VQELHDVSTDSISTGRYIPILHDEKIKNCSKACFWIASIFFMTTIDVESHPPCVVQRSACIQSNFSPRKQSGDNDDYASAALTST